MPRILYHMVLNPLLLWAISPLPIMFFSSIKQLYTHLSIFSSYLYLLPNWKSLGISGKVLRQIWAILWKRGLTLYQTINFGLVQIKSICRWKNKSNLKMEILYKTMWEKEKFLLFPQCLLTCWWTFWHFHHILNCHLQTLSVWKSLKFFVWINIKVWTYGAG